MINDLIKQGREFSKKFTTEYSYGTVMGINDDSQNEYFKWLSKVATYVEVRFKKESPNMTKQIIKIIEDRKVDEKNYNIIIGYLEVIEEQYKQNEVLRKAIDKIYE